MQTKLINKTNNLVLLVNYVSKIYSKLINYEGLH